MKLRNKKTGVIVEDTDILGLLASSKFDIPIYHSLAELNEEWEDYEEPKEYWCITGRGNLHHLQDITDENDKDHREIANYFETKEEAEKAVEKLKAWKRLKDKGFKFIGVRGIGKVIDFDIPEPYNHVGFDEYVAGVDEKEFYEDLLMLFGGEE